MTDKRDVPSDDAGDDAGLKRLLGVLQPPEPSDLLKARVENAIHDAAHDAPVSASAATTDTPPRMAPRQALHGRIAAAVIVAAAVALGTLVPAPQSGERAPVGIQSAGGILGGSEFDGRQESQDAGRNSARENALGLALVGGGTPVSMIGLVSADWGDGDGGTDADSEQAGFEQASFDGTGLEDSSALSQIPLD